MFGLTQPHALAAEACACICRKAQVSVRGAVAAA